MEDSLRHLQKLGFTEYEARTYVALIREHPTTRYQLSQNASIPESKIYEVVRRLQDKGLIAGVHSSPLRFVPLAPEELLMQLEQKTQESLQHLRTNLPILAAEPATQWTWRIEGYDDTLAKARSLIAGATEEIVAAMWHQEAGLLVSDLRAAVDRGTALFFLAYDECPIDFGQVKRHDYQEELRDQLTSAPGRWVALVVDRQQALVGESLDKTATSVWTNHGGLVTITRKYVLEHFVTEGSRLPWS